MRTLLLNLFKVLHPSLCNVLYKKNVIKFEFDSYPFVAMTNKERYKLFDVESYSIRDIFIFVLLFLYLIGDKSFLYKHLVKNIKSLNNKPIIIEFTIVNTEDLIVETDNNVKIINHHAHKHLFSYRFVFREMFIKGILKSLMKVAVKQIKSTSKYRDIFLNKYYIKELSIIIPK